MSRYYIQYSYMSNCVISILYPQILFIIWRSRGLEIFYFFFTNFEKVNFNSYVYIYINFAKKLLGLVICSGEIESFEITSPKISSTLNFVESIISFRLSI